MRLSKEETRGRKLSECSREERGYFSKFSSNVPNTRRDFFPRKDDLDSLRQHLTCFLELLQPEEHVFSESSSFMA